MDYAPLMFKIQRLSENTLVTTTIYKLYLHTKFKEEIFSCKGDIGEICTVKTLFSIFLYGSLNNGRKLINCVLINWRFYKLSKTV